MVYFFRPSTETMDVPDLSGKVIMLTGGYAGLGSATADALLRGKPRLLIIVGDNANKGEAFMEEIHKKHPNGNVELMICDVSNFEAVRKLAADFTAKNLPLHCLINNAGIWFPPHTKTKEGIEITVATNYFGPFLLTQLLLPTLIDSAPSRIVWLSSWAEASGKVPWDDLGYSKSTTSTAFHYGSSKLYDHMASMELADRLKDKDVLVVSCHPGIAYSQFVHKIASANPLRYIVPVLAKIFAVPVTTGAVSTVLAATNDKIEPGGFYGPNLALLGWDQNRWTANPHTWTEQDRKRLYEESLKMVGVSDMTSLSARMNKNATSGT